ncbi:MAG: efflux RND transporter periplasmic adaptor subunit [Clostridiales bacterium]|nr:efflux RND transporter periplasmic adaptor subunit [Clostridiales bacterium]
MKINVIIKKIFLMIIAVSTILILNSCTSELKDPFADFTYEKEDQIIITESVIRDDFIINEVLFAKSIPKEEITQYYTDVTGYFKEYTVDLLQEVNAGDVIAILDSSTLDKQLRDQTIRYEKAQLKYEKAKLEYESTGNNENSMLSVKLDFEYEELKYNDILKQYEALELKAEISGVVTKMQADPGDFIMAKSPITSITDKSEIFISLDSKESEGLRVGEILEIAIRSSTETLNAEIIEINGTETIMKPEFIHESFEKTGTLVYVRILKDMRLDALQISEDSVIFEANRYYVYVMENGVKRERDIKVGISDGGMVEILFGLEEGELVVSNPR